MKFNNKNIFRTILYFILINVALWFPHLWAFFGVAFNDAGDTCEKFIELLPILCFALVPLIIASVFIIETVSKKEGLSKKALYILQSFVVIYWIGFYVYSYMPNSFIRTTFDNIQINNKISKQEELNNRARRELSENDYMEFDNIANETENTTIYIKRDNSKVVVKYNNNDNINYGVANLKQVDVNLVNDNRIKYTKLKSNYIMIMDPDDNVYLSLNDDKYFKIECVDLEIYDIYNNITLNLGDIYFNLIAQSLYSNKLEYIPKTIAYLEIEKNDNIISITDDSLKQISIDYNEKFLDYSWVIMKDGVEILSRGIKTDKLYYNLEDVDKKYYSEQGTYEIYLHIYFNSNFCYRQCYSGYIKASNSIIWTNI